MTNNFIERAELLTARNIPTVPVNPGEKRSTLQHWPMLATTDAQQITQWNTANANFNTAAVCLPDGICVLDADSTELTTLLPQVPETFTVLSAGKRLPHYYFRQTDRSRELGNRKAKELFDFQQSNKYVVGPGSVLADGRAYDIANPGDLAEIPDWLCDWIEENSQAEKKPASNALHGVAESFDFESLMDHYGITGDQNGSWFVTDVCPIAGRRHQQSTETGFYFDGEHLGFKCFAANCDGSSMKVGQVLSHLNKTHKPYSGEIWESGSTWEPAEVKNQMVNGIIYRDEDRYKAALEEWAADWRSLFHTRAETENAPPLEFLIQGFMAKDALTMFGGPPANGKTWVALSVAKALITGNPLFGVLPVQRVDKVLYFVPESTIGPFAARLKKMGLNRYVGTRFFYRTMTKGERLKLTDERIKVAVRDAVVFLDTAVRFMDGDENNSADQRVFADNLFALLQAGAQAVVGLHHATKAAAGQDTMTLENALRGSGDLGAMLANCWALGKLDEETGRVYLQPVKERDTGDMEPAKAFIIQSRPYLNETGDFGLHQYPAQLTYAQMRKSAKGKTGGRPASVEDEQVQRIGQMRAKGMSWKAISAETGIPERTLYRHRGLPEPLPQ
jgi:hypothetical protein